MSPDLPTPRFDPNAAAETPSEDAEDSMARIVEHPDGYYWLAHDGKEEIGPFDSVADALADMDAAGEDDLECGETLEEAEQELGIADWLDPETGEPAEQTQTRIEDH